MTMQNKELIDLLTIIQAKTKKTKGDIAKELDYSRGHLSLAINGHIKAEPIIARLRIHYADVLNDKVIKENRHESFDRMNLAVNKVVLGTLAEILATSKGVPVQAVLSQLQQAVDLELKSLG